MFLALLFGSILKTAAVQADLRYYKCINHIVLSNSAQSTATVMIRGALNLVDGSITGHEGPLEMAALEHDAVRKFSSPKLGSPDQPAVFAPEQIEFEYANDTETMHLHARSDDGSRVEANYASANDRTFLKL